MSFRFSLAAVLRLREIEEEREERALTALLRQISEAQDTIRALESQLRELAHARETLLASSQRARTVHEAEARKAGLQTAWKTQKQHLSRLEELRLQQMARYQQAHRGRKMLTEVRDAEETAWQAERVRREQATADDVFLSRRRPRQ